MNDSSDFPASFVLLSQSLQFPKHKKHFENKKHHFRHVITAPFEMKLMKPTKASYSKFHFDLFE